MLTAMPNFGEDHPPETLTFAAIAAQVRAIKPSALTPQSYDDVLTLIEYLHAEIVKRQDELTRRSNELEAKAKQIADLERSLKLKHRAVDQIVKQNEGKGWTFWRRR
jgi:hypothetical protein